MTGIIKYERLDIAIREADRFLHAARVAMLEHKKESKVNEHWYYSSPKMAAAKRASMDLTKALASFRKNQ